MNDIAGTLWEGVGLRRTRAAADPDSPLRPIALPLDWEDDAAAALAALDPGTGPVSLPRLAEGWIRRLTAKGRKLGLLSGPEEADSLAEALRALLIARRGAPGAETWAGREVREPRFVLNLPAFLDGAGGFDAEAFGRAAAVGVQALDILSGGRAARLRLGFADLAGLIAAFGVAYDSAEGRAIGAAVAALARGAGEAESGRIGAIHGAREPVALIWPAPPVATAIPSLAEAARAALDAAAASFGLRHGGVIALAPADEVEALLGAESAGLAPATGHTRPAYDAAGQVVDRLTRAAQRAGSRAPVLLAPVSPAARDAMAQAVMPFLDAAPPEAPAIVAPPRAPLPREMPSVGPAAETWRVTVGGHRVVLCVTEDDRGRPREIFVSLPREASAFRAAMEGIAQAVSVGLSQGVPLENYVEAFAYARIGPGGPVLGDAAIRQAASVADWVFRRLAIDYLGRTDLPDPVVAVEDAPRPVGELPLLPMELPALPSPRRKRSLRAAA